LAREWLIKARGDITHEQIAKQVGIKRQYYGMIENGTRTPSVNIAKKIAAYLGFDWTIFFKDQGNEMFRENESMSKGFWRNPEKPFAKMVFANIS
jgi:putative transcriptional regulator